MVTTLPQNRYGGKKYFVFCWNECNNLFLNLTGPFQNLRNVLIWLPKKATKYYSCRYILKGIPIYSSLSKPLTFGHPIVDLKRDNKENPKGLFCAFFTVRSTSTFLFCSTEGTAPGEPIKRVHCGCDSCSSSMPSKPSSFTSLMEKYFLKLDVDGGDGRERARWGGRINEDQQSPWKHQEIMGCRRATTYGEWTTVSAFGFMQQYLVTSSFWTVGRKKKALLLWWMFRSTLDTTCLSRLPS